MMIQIKPTGDHEFSLDLLKFKPLKVRKIKNEPAAIRADWINQCADLVDRPFAQMAGLFHGLPTDYIKDLYLKSQETTGNKRAYFWSLYNKTKI